MIKRYDFSQICWNFLPVMCLLSSFNLYSAATPEEIRWFSHTDEWGTNPQWAYSSYHSIPIEGEILFYDNKLMTGKPKFKLAGGALISENGPSCNYSYSYYEKELKEWLVCYPLKCEVNSQKDATKVKLLAPKSNEWFVIDNFSDKKVPCPIKINFAINYNRENRSYSTLELIIEAKKSEPEVLIDGKIYFPDLKNCKKKESGCFFNTSNSIDPISLENRIKATNNPKPDYFRLFEKCLSEKDSPKCLEELTMDVQELFDLGYFPNVDLFYFKKIKWTAEDLSELKACLNNNRLLDSRAHRYFYRGKSKKCFFGNNKIVAIQYPEAFFFRKPITEEKTNYEINF